MLIKLPYCNKFCNTRHVKMPVSLFGKRKPPLLVMLVFDSKADLNIGGKCVPALAGWISLFSRQAPSMQTVKLTWGWWITQKNKHWQATESLLTGSKSSTETLRGLGVSTWSVMTDHLVSTMYYMMSPEHEKRTLVPSLSMTEREAKLKSCNNKFREQQG